MTTNRIIEAEADTLFEAKRMVQSQIPKGYKLLSEQVISDGNRKTNVIKSIEIEAETLESAREQAKSHITDDLKLITERILSDGKPITVKGIADTVDDAYAKTQNDIPVDAEILDRKEINLPGPAIINVEAFNEQQALLDAELQARHKFGGKVDIKGISLTATGSNGFLGIGKKPNKYDVQVFQSASVEVAYRTKAKVILDLSEIHETKAFIRVEFGIDPADPTIIIKPKIKINETGISIYIKVSEESVVFPKKCSLCLSDNVQVIQNVQGKRVITSVSNELVRMSVGLLAPRSTRPLTLVYRGRVPYCKDCAKKRLGAVTIVSFDKRNIELAFENLEYEELFIVANQSIL